MAYINGRQILQMVSTVGSEQWRKIIDVTTTEEVTAIEETVDSNGNTFKLKKARAIITVPQCTTRIASPYFDYHQYSDETIDDLQYSVMFNVARLSSTTNTYETIIDFNCQPFVLANTTYGTEEALATVGLVSTNMQTDAHTNIDYIDYIRLINFNTQVFPIGTKVEMWGVDSDD